ncbi:hypothetical protein DID88_008894 [Monilinia fructigena]|uniref:Uncharacterized protein n=1 Tax=Monilinia fructigena TaxID=38457 RepID=A0A395J6T2_9HELO|nr:hypothetical protein DID88_008894 [Monilinia fructigena]
MARMPLVHLTKSFNVTKEGSGKRASNDMLNGCLGKGHQQIGLAFFDSRVFYDIRKNLNRDLYQLDVQIAILNPCICEVVA